MLGQHILPHCHETNQKQPCLETPKTPLKPSKTLKSSSHPSTENDHPVRLLTSACSLANTSKESLREQ